MSKKFFIVMFGPTGSGKGYLQPFIFDYINNTLGPKIYENKLYKSLIDDYVEQDTTFMKESSRYIIGEWSLSEIKSVEKNINVIVKKIIARKFTKNTKKLLDTSKTLSDIYFNIRKKYNAQNDRILRKKMTKHYNIIFETTGQSSYDWLFNENGGFLTKERKKGYIVILVYPFVDTHTIIKQAISRFVIQAKRILHSKTHLDFARLPNLVALLDSIDVIQDNFSMYLEKCNKDIDINDYIMLIDNRNRKPKPPDFLLFKRCKNKKELRAKILNFIEKTQISPKIIREIKKTECLPKRKRCKCITAAGQPCKRPANKQEYCWQHN